MKRADLLVAEIGSTITKLSAFGHKDDEGVLGSSFLGQGMALTSVDEGDVTIGLMGAMDDLSSRFEVKTEGVKLMASSSAAGGLKMTIHGLTRDMTLKAANEASLGAGAVIAYTTVGEMTDEDIEEIEGLSPKLILLAGGVDYGERDVIIKNAQMLSTITQKKPIIYAGNVSVKKEVEKIFDKSPHSLFVCDNVYPRIDELNLKPVKEVIQRAFSDHIVNAPGMDKVKEMVTGDVIPTPGAVMAASEMLYDKIGGLMTVDVGGATTDVHSVTQGSKKLSKMMVAPEPLAKRTVEGDLGVFYNAENIVKQLGANIKGVGKVSGKKDIGEDIGEVMPLPEKDTEKRKVQLLCRWVVDLAVWRHAGDIRATYGTYGRNEVVEGKDLTAVKNIIGTGGALTRLGNGRDILRSIKRDPKKRKLLPPKDAEIFIDNHYIMAAVGVMRESHPDWAFTLLGMSLGLK